MTEANRLRLLYFLAFGCTASWLPIFAAYLHSRGMSGLWIGTMLAITPALMIVIQPFLGAVADRIGYKKCLNWSSLIAAIAFAAYVIEGGVAWLVAVTVLMSVSYNAVQPLLDSLSLRLSERSPSFTYGSLRIAGAAGWSFTGIVVGQFIDRLDMTVIFIVSGIFMGLTFLISLTLPGDDGPRTATSPSPWRDLRVIVDNRKLLLLLTSVFLVSAGSSVIYYFYFIYMAENGATPGLIGFGLSFQGLCELPLFYLSARIILRLGLQTTLLVTIFTTAFRMVLYAVIDDPHQAILIELLQGISWSLFWVVSVEYVNKLVSHEHRAAGQSLLTAAFYGLGAITGNLWAGYLSDIMKVSEIFMVNACIVGAVGVFTYFSMRGRLGV